MYLDLNVCICDSYVSVTRLPLETRAHRNSHYLIRMYLTPMDNDIKFRFYLFFVNAVSNKLRFTRLLLS